MTSVSWASLIDRLTKIEVVEAQLELHAGRKVALDAGERFADRVGHVDEVRLGLANDPQRDGRRAVVPEASSGRPRARARPARRPSA